MFFYIYDEAVVQSNQAAALTKIENRLIELGINGRTEKLSPLRNIKEVIAIAQKQDAHTVVVVGRDETYIRVANLLAASNIALGYIPFAGDSAIAQILGISDSFEACDVLSRRITKMVDALKVNANYVLFSITCTATPHTTIACDNAFTLSFPNEDGVSISLSNIAEPDSRGERSAVKDHGLIEITSEPKAKGWSFMRGKNEASEAHYTALPFLHAEIKDAEASLSLVLDNVTTIKAPAKVEFKPQQFKLIVGKNRQLN